SDTLELVLGKQGLGSRDDWVKLRAAEACGRMQVPFESDWMLGALKAKDERTRSAALWTLERLSLAGYLPAGLSKKALAEVKKRLKDKVGHVAAMALHCLTAVDVERGMELASGYAESKSSELRAASVQLQARHGPRDQLAAVLARALLDEDFGVRTSAVEECSKEPNKSVLEELVRHLPLEPRPRLQWTIVKRLQELSARKHRIIPEAWQAWVDSLGDDWKRTEDEYDDLDSGEAVTAFAGLNVLSGRVCFLIDFSGSFWKQGRNDKTRKEAAEVELRRALEALPEEAMFNLIPFANEPDPWKEELVRATPRNVKAAIASFEKSNLMGKGNFWDALKLALQDPSVDNIVVLTDGAPTGGRRWNLKLMGPLLSERNRFRRVVLDAVLVDCTPSLVWMWRNMCAEAGGRLVEISL
ncbi:MAG: hypothetical protein ACI841_000827, partial [Planctomycetota bacterium]